jgi:hypothetical protein
MAQTASQAIWQSNLAATPGSGMSGTLITGHASQHTKGSYSQLIASTTYDSHGFWLSVTDTVLSGSDTSLLLDIGIGASGSEVVLAPNLMAGFRPATGAGYLAFLPLFIPRATRVAARLQGIIGGDTANVAVFLNGGSSHPRTQIYKGCDAYGIDISDSGGTAHTAGNTSSESTDANVGTTLSRDYRAVMLGTGFSGAAANARAYHWELTDGTNTLCEWFDFINASEAIFGPFPFAPFEIPLASGTQLQIQGECSGVADARDVAFYCFY